MCKPTRGASCLQELGERNEQIELARTESFTELFEQSAKRLGVALTATLRFRWLVTFGGSGWCTTYPRNGRTAAADCAR